MIYQIFRVNAFSSRPIAPTMIACIEEMNYNEGQVQNLKKVVLNILKSFMNLTQDCISLVSAKIKSLAANPERYLE